MNARLCALSPVTLASCLLTSLACAPVQNKNAQVAPTTAAASAQAATSPQQREECVWSFVEYQPSQWEREWFDAEASGERRDHECEVLAAPREVERSVSMVRAVMGAVLENRPMPPESIALFSRMVYTEKCGSSLRETGRRRAQLIEPLVGIVRDPLTICPHAPGVPEELYNSFKEDEDRIQSKRHLLLGPAAPWSDTPEDPASWKVGGFEPYAAAPREDRPRARFNFMVDMGASTYGNWNGDRASVGAAWFVERNKRHHLAFDWIVSFEYDKIDPENIYRSVPADILPHYIYFDRPVEKAADGKWNPWRILTGMGARPEDYVAVKVDIDTPEIENPLIDQVAADARLHRVVDEMFMEHHVNCKVMNGWWGTAGSQLTIKDTYQKFTALRTKGVRMHGWP